MNLPVMSQRTRRVGSNLIFLSTCLNEMIIDSTIYRKGNEVFITRNWSKIALMLSWAPYQREGTIYLIRLAMMFNLCQEYIKFQISDQNFRILECL